MESGCAPNTADEGESLRPQQQKACSAMTNFPLHPKHPERICWGCEKYCPADDLAVETDPSERPIRLNCLEMIGSSG